MVRAPFQVLVFPYRLLDTGEMVYAVFQRRDEGQFWQAIAGGGEDDETPLQAARREAWEEAGITPQHTYWQLDSRNTVPADNFAAFRDREDLFVVPEYCFAVEVFDGEVRLSREHVAFAWLPYQDAESILRWDSNKNALWELDRRLRFSQRT